MKRIVSITLLLLLAVAQSIAQGNDPAVKVVLEYERLMQQWISTNDGKYREQIERLLQKTGRQCTVNDRLAMRIEIEKGYSNMGSLTLASYLNYIEDKIGKDLTFSIKDPEKKVVEGNTIVYAWVNIAWRDEKAGPVAVISICGFRVSNGGISSISYDGIEENKRRVSDQEKLARQNQQRQQETVADQQPTQQPTSSSTTIPITIRGTTYGNMILVKGGTFSMGATSEQGSDAYDDEKPVHTVTLYDYYIGETEVTCGLWKAVMGSDPSYFKKGDNYPVENVSWNDCQEFIKKLDSLTGKTYRLPTEAEWEYAARGGSKSRGYKYSGSNNLSEVAWYGYYDNNDKNRTITTRTTMPVKSKSPNELGLYDMSGNVYEWCSDWYKSDYYANSPSTNPQGPSPQSYRVLRGGSWSNDARYCRVSNRSNIGPSNRSHDLGFRLALVP